VGCTEVAHFLASVSRAEEFHLKERNSFVLEEKLLFLRTVDEMLPRSALIDKP
jgi:hypothetical protein